MRSRSRTFRDMGKPKVRVMQTRYSNNQTTVAMGDEITVIHPNRVESIVDEVNSKNIKADRAKISFRISLADRLSDPVIRRSVKSDLYTALMQVHKCTHSVERLVVLPEQVFLSTSASFLFTHTSINGYQIHEELNVHPTNTSSLLTKLRSMPTLNSAGGYVTHDWYALLDSWHEQCNSLIPSSSLLGESMVEHAIFADAFKAVLNPSRALKTLIEFAFDFRKKKTTIGKIVKALRTSSDSFLSYNFGIRPALQEINNIVSAHKMVSRRLEYLKLNAGGYVPVRVRGTIPSSITTVAFPTPGTYKRIASKDSVAVISALAKVRDDLNYVKDWHAYYQYFGLHKVIGLGWELVPFSFVADWITNAGEYINKYTTPVLDSPFYNIRNICHSIREESVSEIVMSPNKTFPAFSSTLIGSEPLIIGRYKLTNYSRDAGLPETSGAVDFTRLGTFHALASGALLIQKIIK